MLAAFKVAAERILATLGEDSFLRSTEPCRVNIEHGVQFEGDHDNSVLTKSVAAISATMSPKRNDLLTHPDGAYKLDAKVSDSGPGGIERWIVIKV